MADIHQCAEKLALFAGILRDFDIVKLWIFQIKDLKNRVVCGLVLTLHDGIEHAAFFYGHIVLKNWLAVETEPCVGGTGNGNLNFGIVLHILVNILLVVGAKPQFSILL